MDYITDSILGIFGGTLYETPLLLALPIVGSFYLLLRHQHKKGYPSCYKYSSIFAGIGFIILDFNLLIYGNIFLLISSVSFICAPGIFCIFRFFSLQHKLKTVKRLAHPRNIDYNIIAAWKLLQSLSQNKMLPQQKRMYNRNKIFLLIKLGSIHAIERILDEFQGDQTYYHFIQYIKYYFMGRPTAAANEIKAAEEECTNDTDPVLHLQILINRGTAHVIMQNYQLADDYFFKSVSFYKSQKVQDKELLSVLYYNYAFNKTRLDSISWQDVLKEYRSYLDINDPYDCITFFNTKLELLRQIEASRSEIDQAVHETFSHVMKSHLEKENKYLFALSLVRIVWTARINPKKCLDVIEFDIETIFKLPMPNRYYAFKDLNLLFMDLHGDIAESHHKIREAANSYMSNQAESDLESYRKELPKDAIFEKGFCYRESAGLQKKSLDHYDLKKVLFYIKSAIALYYENSLLIEENICRLDIMDEFCDPKNLNEDYKIIYRDKMLSQLNKIEAYLATLAEPSNLAEFYLRLCFYYMQLDDYEKCIVYYKKFMTSSVSLEHFAPWLHRYHMYTSLVVRISYFIKTIQIIKESKGMIKYPPTVRQWFESFPNHDGFIDSILLGKFMGFSGITPLKQKTWIDSLEKDRAKPTIHIWFWMVPLELNFDITYSQFEDDDYSNCIMFDNDRHPFESNTSNEIRASINSTKLNFNTTQINLSEDVLPLELKSLIDNLYSIIITHVNPECPTIDQIKALHTDTRLPVEV